MADSCVAAPEMLPDLKTAHGFPLEQFVMQLEASGIIPADTLRDFLPPQSDPKDGEELAGELVLEGF